MLATKKDCYGLIIAGGSGSRLWPLSRPGRPKQLLQLTDSEHSLLQESFLRLSHSLSPQRIFVVTAQRDALAARQQLLAVYPQLQPQQVILEPQGRDSAAAVLAGTLRLLLENPQAVMVMVWADMGIGNEQAFEEAIREAYAAAHQGGLVLVGEKPTHANTCLGYIVFEHQAAKGVQPIVRFVEKPQPAEANALLAEACCAWNTGIFVLHAPTLLERFRQHAPTLYQSFAACRSWDAAAWENQQVLQEVYRQVKAESLDYLLLEKAEGLQVLVSSLGWSDIGNWSELHRLAKKDSHNNAVKGRGVCLNSHNCYVHAPRRLVTLVGVQDLVVIDSGDALLVCSLSDTQQVKQLVQLLQERKLAEAHGLESSERPWGRYQVLFEGVNSKVKMIEVDPGQKLSLQLHRQRAEHWVVAEGQPLLTLGETVRQFSPNQHLFIPQGTKHRMENPTKQLVRIIEVQKGDYLGEDDIIRLEDIYQRP